MNGRRRHATVLAVAVVGLALLGPAGPSAASADDPEITDMVGDANFLAGIAGEERDTRPASMDNADLRAVWFETAYETSTVTDPATGETTTQHTPTALLVHFQTEAPVHPTQRVLTFRVDASTPTCPVTFEMNARQNPDADSVTLWTNCLGSGGTGTQVKPSYDGNVATAAFPLDHAQLSQVLKPAMPIKQPEAHVRSPLIAGQNPTIDETAMGRDFTIGQDVPPDNG